MVSRRGIWAIVGALAAASVAGAAGLIYQTDQLQRAYQQNAGTKAAGHAARARMAEERCIRFSPDAQRDCIRETYSAARQGQHDEYDLQAQLVTSAWTRAMGIAAIIGMVVGMVGIALVFVTFRETRRAANSAQRTYLAFLRVEDASLVVNFPSGRLDKATDCYQLKCVLTNFGRSTARVGYYVIADRGGPVDRTLERGETKSFPESIAVPAKFNEFEGQIMYSTPLRNHRITFSFKAKILPVNEYFGEVRGEVIWSRTHYPEEREQE